MDLTTKAAVLDEVIGRPDEVLRQGPKYILAKEIKGRRDNKVAAVVLERKGENLWVVVTVMVNFRKK